MAITKLKSNKRELQAKQTKNTLFKTALELFEEHGFDAVTIEDITKIAGVSKGTFYLYFSTKEDILLDEFHNIDHSYDEAFETISEDASGRERCLLLIDTMTHYCSKLIGLQFLQIVYANQIRVGGNKVNMLADKTRGYYRYITEFVQIGQARGELPDYPEEELIEYFARQARGMIYDWCLYNGHYDLEAYGHKQFELYYDAVVALGNQHKKF